METDTPLYEIFRSHPEWLSDLMNAPTTVAGNFESITIKRLERRLDGLFIPRDKLLPIMVIEFQLFPSKNIELRTVEEMVEVARRNPDRTVEGVIFFANERMDKRPQPWTRILRVHYLDSELRLLEQRSPKHPLPKLLSPVFEKSDAKLEASAAMVYESLGSVKGFTSGQTQTLRLIFASLLLSRFKNKTAKEITAMFKMPDITKTRAGRELIAMGKEQGMAAGLAEGIAEGKKEGKAEGKAQTIVKVLNKRLGPLPKTLLSQISHLDFLQLEQLEDQMLDFPTLRSVTVFMKLLKR